jgi:hypothetical protein
LGITLVVVLLDGMANLFLFFKELPYCFPVVVVLMLLGKLDFCLQKTETRSVCHPVKVSTQSELRTLISNLKL